MFGEYGKTPDKHSGFSLRGLKKRIEGLRYQDLLEEYKSSQNTTHKTLTEPDPAEATDNPEFRFTMLAVYQKNLKSAINVTVRLCLRIWNREVSKIVTTEQISLDQ